MSNENNENNIKDEEIKSEETVETAAENAAEEKSGKPEKSKKPSSKGKRLKHGALAVVFTVFFVAAVVLINVIFNMVLDRFDIAADLSDKSFYSISEETSSYLAGLDDEISIVVTAEEEPFESSYEYYKQVSEITKRVAGANPRFTLQYLDLDENPTFYSKYGNNLNMGDIIVESAKTGRHVIVTGQDYLSPKYYVNGEETTAAEYQMYYQMGYGQYVSVEYYAAAEKCLLSAIMNVTNEDPVRVAFLVGYGVNAAPDALSSLLEDNTYTVETIDIQNVETIDSDIDFAVICAPLYDYTTDDINKLDMWLDNGGKYDKNLMFIPSVQVDEMPNLNKYLNDWGLSLGSGFVYQTNTDYGFSASPTYQQLQLDDSDYAEGIDVNTKSTQGDGLKPITLLFDEYSNYQTQSIISSYDGAVIAPFDRGDWDPSQAEDSGSYIVAAEAYKSFYDQLDPHRSRIFVIGGEYFVDATFLTSTYLNNADIILSIFNNASGKEDVEVTVVPQVFGAATYEITGSQAQLITIIFAVIVPLVVIAVGVVVIIRRKRR